MVAPLTSTERVSAAKSTTGRLKATTTCGAPGLNTDVWLLAASGSAPADQPVPVGNRRDRAARGRERILLAPQRVLTQPSGLALLKVKGILHDPGELIISSPGSAVLQVYRAMAAIVIEQEVAVAEDPRRMLPTEFAQRSSMMVSGAGPVVGLMSVPLAAHSASVRLVRPIRQITSPVSPSISNTFAHPRIDSR